MQTQIDEIFNALDNETRNAFQQWQQGAAIAIKGRSLDLNDALGNLGPVPRRCLERARRAAPAARSAAGPGPRHRHRLRCPQRARRPARRRDHRLEHDLRALASEDQSLREFFQVAPTFENETRLTLRAARRVPGQHPAAGQTAPAGRQRHQPDPAQRSRALAEPAIAVLRPRRPDRASKRGFPALASFLHELRPTLDNLDPFLANLTPVVSWLNYYRSNITDFLSNPPVGLSGQLPPQPGQPAPRHALKQLGYITQESLAVYPNRLPENRGNGYLTPYGRHHQAGQRPRGSGSSPTSIATTPAASGSPATAALRPSRATTSRTRRERSWGRRTRSLPASSPRRSRTSSAAPSSRRSRKRPSG